MLKNTVTGSLLAKLFPTMSKHFLENASQDDVNAAEQEAAVIHQQLNALGESTGTPGAAAVPPVAPVAAVSGTGVPVPAVSAAELGNQVTALTTRATDAEAKVTTLTGQLAKAEQERDQYKAWYDKQAGKGTALPGADATTRGTQDGPQLSAASTAALAQFRQRQTGK